MSSHWLNTAVAIGQDASRRICVCYVFVQMKVLCFRLWLSAEGFAVWARLGMTFLSWAIMLLWLHIRCQSSVWISAVSASSRCVVGVCRAWSSVGEDDLGLLVLLPLPPSCWNYRHVPLWLILCDGCWGWAQLCSRQGFYKLSCICSPWLLPSTFPRELHNPPLGKSSDFECLLEG